MVDILELAVAARGGLALRELSARLGAPKSSLLPLLRDPRARLDPRPLFAHLWRRQARDGREQALRVTVKDDWKRIGGDASGTLLFDLRSDPGETRNRAHQEPDRERELRRLYQQREARARSYAGELRAEATVVHAGRRQATADGRLTDRGGRVLATATTTCLILGPG